MQINNKGQFTIFVILGLVLLIIASLIFLLISQQSDSGDLEQFEGLDSVIFSFNSCISSVFEQEVHNLLNKNIFSGYKFNQTTQYLVYNSSIYLIEFDDIEEIFYSKVLLSYENDCEELIKSFELNNIIVSVEEEFSAKINSEFISFNFGTINFIHPDYTSSREFEFIEYIDFGNIYSFLNSYAALESENPNFFDIGALLISSYFFNLTYEVVHKETNVAIVDLYDINDEKILSFGVGYK